MPWTFAHPAAVLPFYDGRLVRLPLLGLVIGSVAPDLPYYIGRYEVATFAHSFLGALVVCVPLATLVALVVIRCRTILTVPLPQPHRGAIERTPAPKTDSIFSLATLAAATFAGALTHIVWDSFTHVTGAAVRALPILRVELGVLGERTLQLFNVLQHASTVVGVVLLLVAYRRWLTSVAVVTAAEPSRRRIALVIGCAFGSLALAAGAVLMLKASDTPIRAIGFYTAIYATSIFAVAYLTLGFYLLRTESARSS